MLTLKQNKSWLTEDRTWFKRLDAEEFLFVAPVCSTLLSQSSSSLCDVPTWPLLWSPRFEFSWENGDLNSSTWSGATAGRQSTPSGPSWICLFSSCCICEVKRGYWVSEGVWLDVDWGPKFWKFWTRIFEADGSGNPRAVEVWNDCWLKEAWPDDVLLACEGFEGFWGFDGNPLCDPKLCSAASLACRCLSS